MLIATIHSAANASAVEISLMKQEVGLYRAYAEDVAAATGDDATAQALAAAPESDSLRLADVAAEFGKLLGRTPKFSGTPAATGWINNAARMVKEFGPPHVSLARLIEWNADWLLRGMSTINKPTHYEVRDGQY